MITKKVKHYINRFFYKKTHRMLPELTGGSGAAYGQDILIAELLNYKKNGVFIDIGANDGITINNTLFLERELDWSGIAIEPQPSIYNELVKNRNCHTVCGCISAKPGKAKFIELTGNPNMLSTLKDYNTGLTARRLRKNIKRQGASMREIEVDCFTLESITRELGFSEIDFLSVDTEGGELNILKSINFKKLPIKIVSVENNYYTPSIRRYMESSGFFYLGTFNVDEIYIFGSNQLNTQ